MVGGRGSGGGAKVLAIHHPHARLEQRHSKSIMRKRGVCFFHLSKDMLDDEAAVYFLLLCVRQRTETSNYDVTMSVCYHYCCVCVCVIAYIHTHTRFPVSDPCGFTGRFPSES